MRAQANLEALITYAVSVSILIGMFGALSYAGVLKPDSLLPDRCVLEPPLRCEDYALTDSGAVFYLSSGVQGVEVLSIVVSDPQDATSTCGYYSSGTFISTEAQSIQTNAECDISSKGGRATVDLSVEYRRAAGGFIHTSVGTMRTSIS